MTEGKAERPLQVTTAAWLIMIGSTMLILVGFDTVANLRSLDQRERIEEFLSGALGSSLGLGVSDVVRILHVATMVTAGCAAAAAILGFQVLQRNRRARLALTVVAVPLAVAGLVTETFFATIVAVSVAMLWAQPARSWFDGTTYRPPVAASATTLPPPGPAAPPAGAAPQQWSPPETAPATNWPPPAPAPARRPGALIMACVVTWAVSATAFVVALLQMAIAVTDPSLISDRPDSEVVRGTLLLGALVICWSALAAALAGFAFAGRPWARTPFLICVFLAAMALGLGFGVGSQALVLPFAGSLITIVALRRPEVRAWFAQRPPDQQ